MMPASWSIDSASTTIVLWMSKEHGPHDFNDGCWKPVKNQTKPKTNDNAAGGDPGLPQGH